MIDFRKVKLGKAPAKIDQRTLKLARYFTDAFPPAPPAVDYTSGITDWGMMLNDQLGDCTIAACGHAQQVWSRAARSVELTPPDSVILQAYEDWCGYVDGDPSTDQGGVEIDVLNAWRKQNLWNFPLQMYADPNPVNIEEVKKAIFIFGGVYLGVQLPISVQGASVWDVHNGRAAVPGSWGGHAVFVPKYVTNPDGTVTFTCISWGMLIDITQAFWLYSDGGMGPYIDEAHALVSKEFVNLKSGKNPLGLNIGQMETDVQLVTA